jgi:hypothetical protein
MPVTGGADGDELPSPELEFAEFAVDVLPPHAAATTRR